MTLHHFGLDGSSIAQLQPMLERLSGELAVDLRLGVGGGDLVVIDEATQRSVPAQVLQAFCAQRPCIVLRRDPVMAGAARGAIAYQHLRHQLLDEIERLSSPSEPGALAGAVSGEGLQQTQLPQAFIAPDSGFDSDFDSRYPSPQFRDKPLQPGQAQLLRAVHAGKLTPSAERVYATYGPGAVLILDFAQASVVGDADAWVQLRLQRKLPQVAPAGSTLGRQVLSREMDLVLWELGLATGEHELLGAPPDWWHTPLTPVQMHTVSRYTNDPLHREMASLIERGGMTPSELRRSCRCSVRELRCFLQACLFLLLVYWQPRTDPA